MGGIGKPNATGRSSGKRTGREGRFHRPPEGEPFIWITRELMASPAWRARGPTAVKLIDFLLIEHMAHAGTENGNLCAPYDQLVAFGCSRRLLKAAISELQFLGLIEVTPGGRWANTNQPSRYRLTWLPERENRPPTNEWKRVTDEAVAEWRQGRSAYQKTRRGPAGKQNHGSRSGTTVVPHSALPNPKRTNAERQKPQTSAIPSKRS